MLQQNILNVSFWGKKDVFKEWNFKLELSILPFLWSFQASWISYLLPVSIYTQQLFLTDLLFYQWNYWWCTLLVLFTLLWIPLSVTKSITGSGKPEDTYSHSQFSSVAQLCPTLCDPMNHSTPDLPVHNQLPEFTQTHIHRVGDAIQPSYPLSSPSPPAPNCSQHQSLFQWVNSSHEVAKVLEFQL